MTSIRQFLSNDHRHCDDCFAAVEQALAADNPDAAGQAFGQFRDALLAHFTAEEETLFPAFEAQTGMTMGPTRVMRVEHAQMRELLAEADAALRAGQHDDYREIADTLLIMMQQHNMKEENVLYPMCDEHLAADAAAVLEQLGDTLGVPS